MALSTGIVGLPNVGKSTLFNALTKAGNAQAANYPFCTIEPNKATVAVPDKRIDELTALVKPRKTIYAAADFIDIAGLVAGAHRGEGLGNQFLGNIRECAALIHVVRCFEDENVSHVYGEIDPVRDIETIETELVLADLQSVEKRLEKLRRQAKASRDLQAPAEMLENLLAHLNEGREARLFTVPDDEHCRQIWQEMGLLSAKPVIYCANVDEKSLAGKNCLAEKTAARARAKNAGFVQVCARLEEELQELDPAEQAELLASYGLKESSLEHIAQKAYNILGLQSFFTAGPDEVRAWTIKRGSKAPQAAGVIHSDFERGFIRAETVSYGDFMKYRSEAACRNAGVLRTEGRDYIVKDGDIMHFLFNV